MAEFDSFIRDGIISRNGMTYPSILHVGTIPYDVLTDRASANETSDGRAFMAVWGQSVQTTLTVNSRRVPTLRSDLTVPRLGPNTYGQGFINTYHSSKWPLSQDNEPDYLVQFMARSGNFTPYDLSVSDRITLDQDDEDGLRQLVGSDVSTIHKTQSTILPHAHVVKGDGFAGSELNLSLARLTTLHKSLSRKRTAFGMNGTKITMMPQPTGSVEVNLTGSLTDEDTFGYGLVMFKTLLQTGNAYAPKVHPRTSQGYGVPSKYTLGLNWNNDLIRTIIANCRYGVSISRLWDKRWFDRNPDFPDVTTKVMSPASSYYGVANFFKDVSTPNVGKRSSSGWHAFQFKKGAVVGKDNLAIVEELRRQVVNPEDTLRETSKSNVVPDDAQITNNSFLMQLVCGGKRYNSGYTIVGLMSGLEYPLAIGSINSPPRKIVFEERVLTPMMVSTMLTVITKITIPGLRVMVSGTNSFSQLTDSWAQMMPPNVKFDRYGASGLLGDILEVGPVDKYSMAVHIGGYQDTSSSVDHVGHKDSEAIYYVCSSLTPGANAIFILPYGGSMMSNLVSNLLMSFSHVTFTPIDDTWMMITCILRTLVPPPLPEAHVICEHLRHEIGSLYKLYPTLHPLSDCHISSGITPIKLVNRDTGPGSNTHSSDLANLLLAEYIYSSMITINDDVYALPYFLKGLPISRMLEIGPGKSSLYRMSLYYGMKYEGYEIETRPGGRGKLYDGTFLNFRHVSGGFSEHDIIVGRFVPDSLGTFKHAFLFNVVPRKVQGDLEVISNGVSHKWRDGIPLTGRYSSVNALVANKLEPMDFRYIYDLAPDVSLVGVRGVYSS